MNIGNIDKERATNNKKENELENMSITSFCVSMIFLLLSFGVVMYVFLYLLFIYRM